MDDNDQAATAPSEAQSGTPRTADTIMGTPWWAASKIGEMLDSCDEIMRVLSLSTSGIHGLTHMANTTKVLADTDHEGEDWTDRIAAAERLTGMAETEVEAGFPLLHAQACVALWTALESAIDDLLVAWLENEPSAMQADAVSRLSVHIGEYEHLDRRQKCVHILSRLKVASNTDNREGIGQFESLLNVFGLGGPLDDDVRRHLFELQQLRHIIVHRRGIADEKLVARVPRLAPAVGERVAVSHDAVHIYAHAIPTYGVEILQRLAEKDGVSRDEFDRRLAKQVKKGRSGAHDEVSSRE